MVVTETDLMQAICCGHECRRETGYCHRYDHCSEAKRVMQLLNRAHYQSEFELSLAFQDAGDDGIGDNV